MREGHSIDEEGTRTCFPCAAKMIKVVKSKAMRERGPIAGKNLSWKNCCFLIRVKNPLVTSASASGIPESGREYYISME